MIKNKVIISEEMFKRNSMIDINNKTITKKISHFDHMQDFSLNKEKVLTLKRIK